MGFIAFAYQIREIYGTDLLIIGGGAVCKDVRNSGHQPHPRGCLTASLPNGPDVGMYVKPDIEADVTDTSVFVQRVRAVRPERFQVIHFENIDNDVARSIGALASAHALLEEGGLLLNRMRSNKPS